MHCAFGETGTCFRVETQYGIFFQFIDRKIQFFVGAHKNDFSLVTDCRQKVYFFFCEKKFIFIKKLLRIHLIGFFLSYSCIHGRLCYGPANWLKTHGLLRYLSPQKRYNRVPAVQGRLLWLKGKGNRWGSAEVPRVGMCCKGYRHPANVLSEAAPR